MARYILNRLIQFAVVLAIASVAIWAMVFALPGDPATALAGADASAEELMAVRQRLGLDQPILFQYTTWLSNVLQGDLGRSYYSASTVLDLLARRIPATFQLALFSTALTLLLAAPIAILEAMWPKSPAGRFASAYMVLGLAVPSFWLGIILMQAFAVHLRWLPSVSDYVSFFSSPLDALRFSLLPAFAICFYTSSVTARFLSTSLRDTYSRDFVRTARAKGVSARQVFTAHALRNAALPTVTIVGLQLGAFLGGTIVIETVFNYPGLGRLIYTAIGQRDYAVIQGGVLFVVVVFLVLSLLVDLLYAALDPRIRLH